MNQILQHLAMQGIPLIVQEGPKNQRDTNPEAANTRYQLETLCALINNVESLTKVPDRPNESEGPTVPVSDEQSQDAAAAIVLHASNRIIAILDDNQRWKKLPKTKRKTASQELERFRPIIEKCRLADMDNATIAREIQAAGCRQGGDAILKWMDSETKVGRLPAKTTQTPTTET